jgi:hypothetical protein
VQYAQPRRKTADPRVCLTHEDFPEWEFLLCYGADGEVSTFEVRRLLGPPLSARLLHSIPFGVLNSVGRRELGQFQALLAQVEHTAEDRERAAMWAKSFQARPGQRGRPDLEYAQLADAYLALLNQAETTAKPTKALAEQLYLSESRVANLLSEARRRELLTKPPPGRAGGRLTATAERLLAQREGD